MAKEVRQGRYGKVVKKNEPGVCSIAWCARPTLWKGYCETHYARNRKGRDMDKPFKENHGMVKSPTHIAWTNMWQRTSNPNHRDYKYYGGRGIKVEQNDCDDSCADKWVADEAFNRAKQAIQQELLKARLNELVKLKDAHSITIFDEYLENHIADLQAKLKEKNDG